MGTPECWAVLLRRTNGAFVVGSPEVQAAQAVAQAHLQLVADSQLCYRVLSGCAISTTPGELQSVRSAVQCRLEVSYNPHSDAEGLACCAAGTYDQRKLLGVTKLDVVRAQQFIGEILAVDPAAVAVPVVGGHAGVTILPLLSQVA